MDPQAVVKAVEAARAATPRRRAGSARTAAGPSCERYNWENEFAKLDDLYRRLL